MIIHNKAPLWSCNRPLKPHEAKAGTTMDQICGEMCRLQLTLDLHFPPGDPVVAQLYNLLNKLMPVQNGVLCLEPGDWRKED